MATLCGKKVCNMFPWVPMMGNGGFGLLCYSYNDHLTITVQTDKKLGIESRELCRLYFQQYEQILKENLSAEEILECHDHLYQRIWAENKKAGATGSPHSKGRAAAAAAFGASGDDGGLASIERKGADDLKLENSAPVLKAGEPAVLEFKAEVDEDEILNPGEKDDERTSSRKKLPSLEM